MVVNLPSVASIPNYRSDCATLDFDSRNELLSCNIRKRTPGHVRPEKDLEQPAHLRCLIRIFSGRILDTKWWFLYADKDQKAQS